MSELRFYGQAEAEARMNHFGEHAIPFFFLIDFDGTHCLVEQPEQIPVDQLQYIFPHASHVDPFPVDVQEKPFCWHPHPQTFDAYRRSFDIVHRNLLAGNSFLANLTCATPVQTDLGLYDIFRRSQALYKVWWKDRFTVFSPEIFVRIENGYIYSHPMKGTIDATLPDARRTLLGDVKETAEHATITDLIRNDLSQVADEVTVVRYRYIDCLQTHCGPLLQMSSEVRGRLPHGWRMQLGTLFFRLLPAGSITGAPKRKTVEIIREAETYRRGFYTGVAGYFDGQSLDSTVLIRFVEQGPHGDLLFKSGGGITYRSDAQREYEEMKQKVYVPIY